MFGYDFLIDENFNTWILEINKSPSMDTNTVIKIYYNLYLKAVTQDLVKKV